MNSLGQLVVRLGLDAADFISSLTKSEYQAKQAMDRIKHATEESTAAWKKFGAAVGGAISVAGVLAFVKQTISAAAALDDMAERTGSTVESLSALSNVAAVGGHSLETLEAGLLRTAKALGGTDEKAKEATAALQAIGLDRNALRQLDPAQAYLEIAKQLDKYRDGLGKTAFAIALWGKAGAAQLPILKDLAEQQETLKTRTTEEAAAAEQLEKNFKRLGLETTQLKKSFVIDAIPALNEVVSAMREAYKEGGTLMALWVGLGGAAANALGVTDRQKDAARIKEIDEQLGRAREQLEKGSLNPKGASDKFFSFLIPDIKLGDQAVTQLRGTIDRLEAEKKRLVDATKPPPKEVKPDVPLRESDDDKNAAKQAAEILKLYQEVQRLAGSLDVTMPQVSGTFDDVKEQLQQTKKLLEEGKKGWIAHAEAVFADAAAMDTANGAGESFTQASEKLTERILNLIDPTRQLRLENEALDKAFADGSLRVTEYQLRLAKLDPAVRALLQPLGGIHDKIQKDWERGFLSTEEMQRLSNDAIANDYKETANEITAFWTKAAEEMQASMSGFFFDIMQGNLKDLGSSFKRTIDKMVADVLAAKAAAALFGDNFGKGGGQIGGLVGSALSALGLGGSSGGELSALGYMDAGAYVPYATGTDFVPRDGPAYLHRGEAVIPAALNRGGASSVTYAPQFVFKGQVSKASMAQVEAAAFAGFARSHARNS